MGSVQPKRVLAKRTIDKWLDALSATLLGVTWIYTIVSFTSLPAQIPVHFNFNGEADNFGSKVMVFTLPGIITLVWSLLTVLNRFPHVFNYPVKITAENAERLYLGATRLIRIMKLVIVGICMFITYKIVRSESSLQWWFLPLVFICMLTPVIIFIYRASKNPLR